MSSIETQDPAEYTRLRALELRHDWQFSRLFLPRESRAAFNALLALRVELADQLGDVSEAAIGMAKLEWWRSEIERGFAGSAQHPLAVQLGALLGEHDVAVEYVLEQLDAVEMIFLPGGIESLADEKLFRYRRDGVLAEIAAQLSGIEYRNDNRKLMHAARAIGELRAHVDAITSMPAQLQSGRPAFSVERLFAQGIAAETPVDPHAMEKLRDSAWQTWNELRVAARTAMEDVAMPPALLVQWQLLEADYRALAKRRNVLGTESLPLPGPLRRLFIAWNAARKAIKHPKQKTRD